MPTGFISKTPCSENETQILTCPRSQSHYVGMPTFTLWTVKPFIKTPSCPCLLRRPHEMLSQFVQPWTPLCWTPAGEKFLWFDLIQSLKLQYILLALLNLRLPRKATLVVIPLTVSLAFFRVAQGVKRGCASPHLLCDTLKNKQVKWDSFNSLLLWNMMCKLRSNLFLSTLIFLLSAWHLWTNLWIPVHFSKSYWIPVLFHTVLSVFQQAISSNAQSLFLVIHFQNHWVKGTNGPWVVWKTGNSLGM